MTFWDFANNHAVAVTVWFVVFCVLFFTTVMVWLAISDGWPHNDDDF